MIDLQLQQAAQVAAQIAGQQQQASAAHLSASNAPVDGLSAHQMDRLVGQSIRDELTLERRTNPSAHPPSEQKHPFDYHSHGRISGTNSHFSSHRNERSRLPPDRGANRPGSDDISGDEYEEEHYASHPRRHSRQSRPSVSFLDDQKFRLVGQPSTLTPNPNSNDFKSWSEEVRWYLKSNSVQYLVDYPFTESIKLKQKEYPHMTHSEIVRYLTIVSSKCCGVIGMALGKNRQLVIQKLTKFNDSANVLGGLSPDDDLYLLWGTIKAEFGHRGAFHVSALIDELVRFKFKDNSDAIKLKSFLTNAYSQILEAQVDIKDVWMQVVSTLGLHMLSDTYQPMKVQLLSRTSFNLDDLCSYIQQIQRNTRSNHHSGSSQSSASAMWANDKNNNNDNNRPHKDKYKGNNNKYKQRNSSYNRNNQHFNRDRNNQEGGDRPSDSKEAFTFFTHSDSDENDSDNHYSDCSEDDTANICTELDSTALTCSPSSRVSTHKAAKASSTTKDSALNTLGHELVTPNVWTLDSAATRHVTAYKSIMRELESVPTRRITGINGKPLEVNEVGLVPLTNKIALTNVYHIPGASANLVSLGRMLNAGCRVVFTNKDADISYKGERLFTFTRKDENSNWEYTRLIRPHRNKNEAFRVRPSPSPAVPAPSGEHRHDPQQSTKPRGTSSSSSR